MKPKIQNRTHAVMSQRTEPADSFDNFPTPPWATRALLELILDHYELSKKSCLEPACGAGHMAKVQREYFKSVTAKDIFDYGYGEQEDFLKSDFSGSSFDWVITNPPFKLAEAFVQKGLEIATDGVAMLTRTVFLESVGRYERLFNLCPPSIVAQFSERVPMVKGRLDAKATTATGYAWIIWEKNHSKTTSLRWIKPCRKQLERRGDYMEFISSSTEATEKMGEAADNIDMPEIENDLPLLGQLNQA
jgi:hypothetical protein